MASSPQRPPCPCFGSIISKDQWQRDNCKGTIANRRAGQARFDPGGSCSSHVQNAIASRSSFCYVTRTCFGYASSYPKTQRLESPVTKMLAAFCFLEMLLQDKRLQFTFSH